MRADLPDELWTDPRCIFLRKRRRRLWVLLCDMERLRARWHPDSVGTWTLGVWAANLDVTERRLCLDLETLRGLGLVAPDAIRLEFCRLAQPADPAEGSGEAGGAHRPRYPSDERRGKQTPQPLRNGAVGHSAESEKHSVAERPDTPQATPQPLRTESTEEPPDTAQMAPLTYARATGTGTCPAGSLYINQTGPVPAGTGPVRIEDEFILLGMQPGKAAERVAEFGEERCRQALEALEVKQRSKKPPRDAAGFLVDFLVNKRPAVRTTDPGQKSMPMLHLAGNAKTVGMPDASEVIRMARERGVFPSGSDGTAGISEFLAGTGPAPGGAPPKTMFADLKRQIGGG